MREFFHAVAAALTIAAMAGALASMSTPASAQGNQQAAPPQTAPLQSGRDTPPALKQMALTDKQIEGVLAAQKDIESITETLPDIEKPDLKSLAQLQAAAKKHGF